MKSIIISALIFVSSLSYAQKSAAKYLPESFFNCWSASFEEDNENDKLRTYRNCDYKFPPRMYRPTVKFNKDGTCEVLKVGPTDEHYSEVCTWSYDKRKKRIVVTDKTKVVQFKFQIKLVEKDVMKVMQEIPV